MQIPDCFTCGVPVPGRGDLVILTFHSFTRPRRSAFEITETELIESMMRMFDKQDKNHDGNLSGEELTG
jgi:hypothetical protein